MDKANNCRSQKFLAAAILCFLFTFTIVNNSRADWKALFYDDFESGDLSKWTITIEPDSPTPAGWEIMGESENNVLRGRGQSWAELTNKYWRNYNLTFRLKIITGQIHVCVKLSDQGRYLIRFANNSVTIEKESPWGTFTFLRSSSPTLNLNEWYGVEIRIISESIEVYLNNDKILTAEDPEYLVSGGIGFETLGEANEWTSEVLIDDVSVMGEAGGSISGVVTSEGKPVSGIPVQAFSDPCQYSLITQSRTDSLGNYTLEDLPDEDIYVHVCPLCDHFNYQNEWYNGGEGTQSCRLATPITIKNSANINDVSFSIIKGPKILTAFDLAIYNNELHSSFFVVPNFRKLLKSATLTGPNSFLYHFDLTNDAILWDTECRPFGIWYYHNFGDFTANSYSYGTYSLTLTFCDGSKYTYFKELKNVTVPESPGANSMYYVINDDGSADFYWDPSSSGQMYQLRIRDSEEREFYFNTIQGTLGHLHVDAYELRCLEPGENYKWFLRSYNEPIDYSFGIASYSAVGESKRKDFVYYLPANSRRSYFWVGDWLGDLYMDVFVRPGSLGNVKSIVVKDPNNSTYSFDMDKDRFDLSTITNFFRGWWHNFGPPVIYGNFQLDVVFSDGHCDTLVKDLEPSEVIPVDSKSLDFDIHQDGAITFRWALPENVDEQVYVVKIRNLDETKEYFSSPFRTDMTTYTASSWGLRTLQFGNVYKWTVRTYNLGINTGRQTQWIYFRYDPFDIACVPDLDKDGDVDGTDIASFVNHFGENGCPDNCDYDFDVDGNVGESDIALLARKFGQNSCPSCN